MLHHLLPPSRRASTLTTSQLVRPPLSAAAYQPVERGRYADWEARGLFRADAERDDAFSMVLPPPNVTGKLHLGHALACSIQDAIVRRQRSLGKSVLWLPGTDHAGIATQGVVEKYLKNRDNVNRYQLGREKFNQEVWKWKEKHGDAICQQLRTLGASLDWSRLTFTLDPLQIEAVNTAFIRMFEKGLIYRKQALVNWCIPLKSTLSDIEVDNLSVPTPTELSIAGYERPIAFGFMTEFAYKVCDSSEEVVVATTRLETMLGDVAIAVHPQDERYKHLHGARVHHPFREETIPIILDEFVDVKFGTGAVKITPAHDKTDYEVSQRHNLKIVPVINEDGCMNENSAQFKDMRRYDCRDALSKKLNDLGVLRNITPHAMSLPICSRTDDVIETLPKEQWFVSCTELNKKAVHAVQSGQMEIEPDNFVKNWVTWSNDTRDWCISRQLWWGHQIPAYECCHGDKKSWVAALNESEARSKAAKILNTSEKAILLRRDEDVLDTWFSSGIYPFSSLGWPKETNDFATFYPLTLMATGHDILGFWVHRMVLLGLELTGRLPFNKVLLHGVICDNKGAKMSKSRGNVIDPIDVINGITLEKLNERSEEMYRSGILNKIELQRTKAYNKSNFSKGIPECGVDALRFTLLSTNIKSHFVHFDVDMCHSNKLFCNKIWQSIKYLQMSFVKLKDNSEVTRSDLTKFDRWILSRLARMVDLVNKSMDTYDFYIATTAIKKLLYYEFCDIYLETTKPGFDNGYVKQAYAHAHTLSTVLNVALRCLAPFMVYVTEELIPKVPGFEESIIHNFNDLDNKYYDFPQIEDFSCWRDQSLENEIELFNDTVSLVRQLKGFYGIPNKVRPDVYIKSRNETISSSLEEKRIIFTNLTRCGDIHFADASVNGNIVTGILNQDCIIKLQLEKDIESRRLIDSANDKLKKKKLKIEDSISKIQAKISNVKYAQSAPESVQIADKEKIDNLKAEFTLLSKLSEN